MQTMLVIYGNLFAGHCGTQRIQTFLIAEAVICITLLDQLFGIFQINTLGISLTLHVGANTAILVRSFIMYQTGIFQCTVDDLQRTFLKTLLICILDTQHKTAALMLSDQVCVQCGTQIADMHTTCGAGRKSCLYFTHNSPPENLYTDPLVRRCLFLKFDPSGNTERNGQLRHLEQT